VHFWAYQLGQQTLKDNERSTFQQLIGIRCTKGILESQLQNL